MELLYLIAGIGIGFGYGFLLFRKKPEEKKAPPVFEEKAEPEERIPDPMSLRNGYGITRAKNPTFAEQWVNILNYDGRNQKEEDYGGEEDYSAENMG